VGFRGEVVLAQEYIIFQKSVGTKFTCFESRGRNSLAQKG